MLSQLNEKLRTLYENKKIDGGDISEVAEKLDLSRITVWKYARGNGLNKNTAIDILDALQTISDEREQKLQRLEIIKEDLNND